MLLELDSISISVLPTQLIFNIEYFSKIAKVCNTRCENIEIFLSFRFYVKSTLENVEDLKLPFCKFQTSKSAKSPKMADFTRLASPKIDFT